MRCCEERKTVWMVAKYQAVSLPGMLDFAKRLSRRPTYSVIRCTVECDDRERHDFNWLVIILWPIDHALLIREWECYLAFGSAATSSYRVDLYLVGTCDVGVKLFLCGDVRPHFVGISRSKKHLTCFGVPPVQQTKPSRQRKITSDDCYRKAHNTWPFDISCRTMHSSILIWS